MKAYQGYGNLFLRILSHNTISRFMVNFALRLIYFCRINISIIVNRRVENG